MAAVSAVAKGRITTIEGLGTVDRLHPLQRAFIAEQACQCGFCGNGMVMSAKALLDRTPRPNDRQIKQALNGHLCRCASHNRIVRAVQRAAEELRAAGRRGAAVRATGPPGGWGPQARGERYEQTPPAEASPPNKEMRS